MLLRIKDSISVSVAVSLFKRLFNMFVYSLPLFFSQVGLASPLELLIMVMALFGMLLMSAGDTNEITKTQSTASYLFAAWMGQARLVWVFWPFFIILNANAEMSLEKFLTN